MFQYLEVSILSRNLSRISLLRNAFIIMEVYYMFLYLEICISYRNPSTDFSNVIYL